MSENLIPFINADPAWLEEVKAKMDRGEVTPEQWERLRSFFEQNQHGPIQPSMICKGAQCPYYDICPIQRSNLPLPIGLSCPLEETARTVWFQNLRRELGTKEDGFEATDLSSVCDIISILLQKQRVQWELAKNPEVAERVIRGVDVDGTPLVEVRPNPAFYTLKALNQAQLKISEALMTTREARSKDESRKTSDAAQKYAALSSLADRLHGITVKKEDGTPVSPAELLYKLKERKTADERTNTVEDD